MATLSKTLFGRNYSFGEWIVTIVGLSAGILTILQNLSSTTLSTGIQNNITKSPTDTWSLFLGIILIISVIMYVRRK